MAPPRVHDSENAPVKTFPRIPALASAFTILLLVCGCTETAKMKVAPTAFHVPASSPSQASRTAALVLDKSFTQHQCEMHLIGGTRVFPLGGPLTQYARDTAKQLFSQVREFDSEAAAVDQADLILVPHMARSSLTGPVPFKALLRTEWTVKDRAGQQTVWLTSVDGTSEVRPGFGAAKKAERQAWQDAFDQLARKTVEAFQASPELARQTAK